MIYCTYTDFRGVRQELQYLLAQQGKRTNVGEWQSIKNDEMPQSKTIELTNVIFEMNIPESMMSLAQQVEPNLPFAEAQFQDRVSGKPLNPPPSDQLWPWAHHLEDDKPQGKYSHTYPERFWPKQAGPDTVKGRHSRKPIVGIRFPYGDLQDVVHQLASSHGTRQCYLPVWFPEDTGAVHGERVPCSLGYHFLLRNGKLNCTYFIRSVDFFRHFPDDVYMAARLLQWVCGEAFQQDVEEGKEAEHPPHATPGMLTMHIISLHVFEAEHKRLLEGR